MSPADLAGLRYFAQSGDTTRLKKEIERLQNLYPDWTPPEDLASLQIASDPELDRMWKAFAEGEYSELRRLIDERRQADPDWSPPEDMLEKLDTAEARSRLVNASHLEQYTTVIRIAANNPELLTCANVDVLWRLADAFIKEDKIDRAKDAYFYILKNCDVPSERISTIRKAIDVLPDADIDQLIAEERLKADGQGEFEAVRNDLVRLSIARSLKNGKAANPEDLARIEQIADAEDTDEDALLLGWYFLEQKNFAVSEDWFRKASLRNKSEEAAQGLGLALIGAGKATQAEAVLRPWWDTSARDRANYLAAVSAILAQEPREKIDASVFETIVQAVAKARDSNAARQIGWYAYEIGQSKTAADWFQVALRWDASDEAAAYGLALALRKLEERSRFETLVAHWSDRSARIAALAGSLAQKSAPVSRSGQARAGVAASNCDRYVPPSALSPAAALSRGWCLMNRNRPLEAVDVFAVALSAASETTRSDAAYGQSLAYLRLGLVERASVAATQGRMSPVRTRELQLSLLSKRASAAFEAGRYTETLLTLDERRRYEPEQVDLMLLRGYAYAQMGRYEDALQVFEALASAGYSDGKKGVTDTHDLRRGRSKEIHD
ncbi:cellulose synthase [Labrenzia sp. 011]|uniref:cellulose synthase n=1 Tax=Labrenzia sp. 011 TaxID=2171494 RepID=UPI001056E7A7|nr:cellulose synthase [Labrenzia sp. 011]